MNNLVFIRHQDLTEELIQIICEIKASSWNYSLEEHKKWINKNIKDLDIHVLLRRENRYVAYLNLVQINLLVGNNEYMDSYGIGNVCSKIKSKRNGSELILGLNQFLIEKNKCAILFCKIKTTKFYLKNNYRIENEDENNIFCMSFNNNLAKIEYDGKRF